MLITCPSCSAQYNVDDSQIPPQGVNIKCPKCVHQFTVIPDAPAAAPSSGVPLPGAGGGGVPLPGAGGGGVPLPGAGGGGVPLPGAGGGSVPLPGAGGGGVPLPGAGGGGVPLPGAGGGGVPLPGAGGGGVPLPGAGGGGVPLPGSTSGAGGGGVPLPGAAAGAPGGVPLPGNDLPPAPSSSSMEDIFGAPGAAAPAPVAGPPATPPARSASLNDIFGSDDAAGGSPLPDSPFHGNNSVLMGNQGGLLDFIDETAKPTEAPTQLFRIRKRSGRIIGPFDEATILDMFRKGELGGAEEASTDGIQWRPLSQIQAFAATIQNAAAAALSGLDLAGVDLPGLPSADLPGLPQQNVDLPGLPHQNADLPGLRAQNVGLPTPAGVGLPTPAGVGLPTPAGVGLPTPAGAGLPVPVTGNEQLSTGQLLDAQRTKERAEASLKRKREKAGARPLLFVALLLLLGLVGAGVALNYTTPHGWFGYKFVMAQLDLDDGGGTVVTPKNAEEAPPPIDIPKDIVAPSELLKKDNYKSYRLGAEQQGQIVTKAQALAEIPPEAKKAAATQARMLAHLVHFERMPLFVSGLKEAVERASNNGIDKVIGQAGALYADKAWDKGISLLKPYIDPAKGLKENDLAEVMVWRAVGEIGKDNKEQAMTTLDEALQAEITNIRARYLQAKLLIDIGKPDYAADYITSILAQEPDHPRAKLLQGIYETFDIETRASGEKKLLAIAKGESAADAAPTQRADAYMGIAKLELGERRWDKALNNMNKAVELVPSSKDVRLEHGKLALQLREFTVARESFQKLLEVNPKDNDALIGLVQAKIGARDALGAYQAIEAASKAAPKDAQLKYWYGIASKELLKTKQAVTLFEEAAKTDPNLPGPHVELIQNLIDKGNLKDALNLAAQAQDQVAPGQRNRIRVMKALIFMRQRSHSLAKKELEQAIKENPANIEARVLYVDHLVGQGQNKEAAENAQQALLLDPRNPRVIAASAAVEGAQGNHEKAIELLEEATSLAPNDYTLYLRAASASIALGDMAGAKAFIDTAGQLQPSNPEVLNLRGQVLRNTDPKQAARIFVQAIEKSPADPRLRYELGMTYVGMGANLEAIDRLQEAIKIDPGFADAFFQLGKAYRELGRNLDAKKAFRSAAKLDKKRADAWVEIAEIHATLGDSASAIAAFKKAVKAGPGLSEPVCKMGITLVERLGENKKYLREGKARLLDCIKLAPKHPEAYRRLADAMKDTGKKRDAIRYYKKHLAINPQTLDRIGICETLKDLGSGC